MRSTTVGAAIVMLPLLVPTPCPAKDGHGSDDKSHAVAVAAADCLETAGILPSARAGGAFTVRDGASTSLVCRLPTEELARSADDREPVTLDIAYLDGDGPGAALVSVALVRTTLAADPDGFEDTELCAWSSAAGGPLVGTTARLVCPGGLVENGFYHLRVALASVPGIAASFIGVVARR